MVCPASCWFPLFMRRCGCVSAMESFLNSCVLMVYLKTSMTIPISILLHCLVEAHSDIQPNREILAPPGVDTEQDKEQVLSIGKHPSLMKVIQQQN